MFFYSSPPVRTKKMACQADWDNHANQLNPNHPEYWHSREQPSDDDTGAYDYQSSSSDDYFQEDFDSVTHSTSVLQQYPRQREEMVRLIHPKNVRYGVEYENTYCVIGGPDILLPTTIPKSKMRSRYDGHMDSPVYAFESPEETIEAETVKLQQWWRFVRRWPEKQKADACMIKAMKMRTNIVQNQKRISELNKELRTLYADDAKLQKKCHEAFGGAIHYYRRLCPEYPYGYRQFSRAPDTRDIINTLTEIESGGHPDDIPIFTWYRQHVDGFASWSAEFTNRWLQRELGWRPND